MSAMIVAVTADALVSERAVDEALKAWLHSEASGDSTRRGIETAIRAAIAIAAKDQECAECRVRGYCDCRPNAPTSDERLSEEGADR